MLFLGDSVTQGVAVSCKEHIYWNLLAQRTDAAVAQLEEIEGFHKVISSVFKAELKVERAKLEKELAEYDRIIGEYEEQLQELIKDPKLSKVILTQHTTLLQERERMQKENEAYAKLQQLKTDRDADAGRLQKLKQEQFAIVSYRINEEMSRLNDAIYEGSYNAPALDFTENGYHFFTPDDTGTGIAYKGLVVYDLAVLGLTKLPVLAHDSVVLKQISDDAIERIAFLTKVTTEINCFLLQDHATLGNFD